MRKLDPFSADSDLHLFTWRKETRYFCTLTRTSYHTLTYFPELTPFISKEY